MPLELCVSVRALARVCMRDILWAAARVFHRGKGQSCVALRCVRGSLSGHRLPVEPFLKAPNTLRYLCGRV